MKVLLLMIQIVQVLTYVTLEERNAYTNFILKEIIKMLVELQIIEV